MTPKRSLAVVHRHAAGVGLLSALMVVCLGTTGCLVAGYSSRGGAFFWPGGLGGLLLLVLLFLFLRGRR